MIIKNADVVTKDGVKKLDIRIENGRIAALGKNLSGEGLDCTGLTVFPGLIERGHRLGQCGGSQGRLHADLLHAQHQARDR